MGNDFIFSAWLKSTEHDIIKRIDRRLELATNLGIETAEDLQVHNYGIGGYFSPHFDCTLISIIFICGSTFYYHYVVMNRYDIF
ncbi:unnamed protein product [Onchocerca ochengi]|uniref:Fe2OG dioxygenase domain-containing protein n=1 Tax=Onchocerca ochengi TaxID=42157 RepID=A0A182EYU1_ONCOC|nr:unnamed protein product [Onchocerca ochengi]